MPNLPRRSGSASHNREGRREGDGNLEDTEAASRLFDGSKRRYGSLDGYRAGRDQPKARTRIPPDKPPARMPRLRQGRRMSAAGHHLQVRTRRIANEGSEAR